MISRFISDRRGHVLAALALAGCRAILGAEPLEFRDGEADAAAPPASDGGDAGPEVIDAPVDAGPCAERPDCERVVFVTKDRYPATALGIDKTCRSATELATAHPALRGRVFVAWMSTSAMPASTRLVHGTRPYRDVNGRIVAVDWAALTSGASIAIAVDQEGASVEGGGTRNEPVWTGTAANGGAAAANCDGWTSVVATRTGRIGTVGGTGAAWTDSVDRTCDTTARIYCIEK